MHVEHAAQIDDVEHIDPEIAQIVVHGLCQFTQRHRRNPRSIGAAPGANFCDDGEIVRVGVKRLADDLVGDVRPVEIAGIDVVLALRYGLAQDGHRRAAILGRAENARPGKLHGAITQAINGAVAESESAGFLNTGHGRSPWCDHPQLDLASIYKNRHSSYRSYENPNNESQPS